MPSRMFGKGREALADVWKTFPEVQVGSGGPPKGPGGVGRLSQRFGRPSWRSGRGREAKRWFGRGREALLKVQEGSGGPLRSFGSVWEALPKVREG